MRAEARSLDGLMDEATLVRQAWANNDYAPMIEHQLDAELVDDLVRIFPNATETLAGIGALTFGDLLSHPAPSVPALRLVKEFAKQLGKNAWLAYPEPVANVLYFAAIAAAECQAQANITELPRPEVLKGYRWARAQVWTPAGLKGLFENALAGGG